MLNPNIPAPNIMLVGATGSGKTYCTRTLLGKNSHIKEVFHLFTEPSIETLADIPCSKGLHYTYVPLATPSWETLISSARDINSLSLQALTQKPGMNKKDYSQYMTLLGSLHNFTCDRCGKEFGDISTWKNDRAFILDSLSGINTMVMDLVIGAKPIKSQADWGIAMNLISQLINKLCADTKCLMTLITHLEIERDEITGQMRAMPSTLGKKLAPVISRYFSEVIHCIKTGAEFTWSTETTNVDTKNRNLPISSRISPNYQEILRPWLKQHLTETAPKS